MMFGKKLGLIALALGVLLALTGCGSKHESFRYRLTVEVETPQGPRTGSSVIEVEVSQTGENAWTIPEARGVRSKVRGEAVAVDLPGEQVLFVLLSGAGSPDRAAGLPYAALDPPAFEDDFAYIEKTRALERIDRLGLVPRDAYPMLVTFGDRADPTSVERVDPDDLAASFGEGVRLKRITVQMTDDPITIGVRNRLKWLDAYRRRNFDGTSSSLDMTTDELAAHLSGGSFSTEFDR